MAVKMRLSRKGRKKAPFYHIVVADARSPRDGKFIEKLGTYNPMTKPATIEIDRNAAYDWLVKGAQPTDTVKAILRFKGVYYKKHLMRGVNKGAMTTEQADILWQQWIDAKENKIESRRQQTKAEEEAFRVMVSGTAKQKVIVADEETKDAAHAFRADSEAVAEAAEDIVSETPVAVEETATEVQSSVAEVVETPAEIVEEVVADVVEKQAEIVEEVVTEVVETPAEEVVAEVTEAVAEVETPEANETTDETSEDSTDKAE
ncbi:MAG: 30S ribosomal protein S16 [Saprospiraceae bacterium]|jgi:small subunit ribosomal protein S16|nr:30S ribosomal protein S16 [Saprospiraceae bacterium]